MNFYLDFDLKNVTDSKQYHELKTEILQFSERIHTKYGVESELKRDQLIL